MKKQLEDLDFDNKGRLVNHNLSVKQTIIHPIQCFGNGSTAYIMAAIPLFFTSIPVTGNLLVLDDGSGDVYTFEFGSASGGHILVELGATEELTLRNLVSAINGAANIFKAIITLDCIKYNYPSGIVAVIYNSQPNAAFSERVYGTFTDPDCCYTVDYRNRLDYSFTTISRVPSSNPNLQTFGVDVIATDGYLRSMQTNLTQSGKLMVYNRQLVKWVELDPSMAVIPGRETIIHAVQCHSDGSYGDISPALLIWFGGNPVDGDTVVLTDGSTTEVYEFDDNASVGGGNIAVPIGGAYDITLENFAGTLLSNSAKWYRVARTQAFFQFAGNAYVLVIAKNFAQTPDSLDKDRIYGVWATQSDCRLQTYQGMNDYSTNWVNYIALPAVDPKIRTFGFGRNLANTEQLEVHPTQAGDVMIFNYQKLLWNFGVGFPYLGEGELWVMYSGQMFAIPYTLLVDNGITAYFNNVFSSSEAILPTFKRKAYCYYDFAAQGGAVGEHILWDQNGEVTIPIDTIITLAWINVITAFAGGIGCQVEMGVKTDDEDGILALGILTTLLTTTGWKACVPINTPGTFTQAATAFRNLILKNDTADLTAGKLLLVFEYMVPPAI